MTTTSREIVARMNIALPMKVTLPDPITGEPFTVDRDNLLALLAVDASNLVLESQTVAALYGEMARLCSAAQRLLDDREVQHRGWKSQKRMECKSKASSAGDKAPSNTAQEDFYRTHADYEREYSRVNEAKRFVHLFGDLKEAFALKQRALHNLHGVEFGHVRNETSAERITELSMATPADCRGYVASADYAAEYRAGNIKPPLAAPALLDKPAAPKAAQKPRRTKK